MQRLSLASIFKPGRLLAADYRVAAGFAVTEARSMISRWGGTGAYPASGIGLRQQDRAGENE